MAGPVLVSPDPNVVSLSMDTLVNLTTGMGTNRDPLTGTIHTLALPIGRDEADALYLNDWLGAAVVDAKPDDATREWREITGLEPDQLEVFLRAEKDFKTVHVVNQGLKWARLYGGAGAILGLDGTGEMHEPLDISLVKQDSLKWITLMDRWHLIPTAINFNNPLRANWGKPEFYRAFAGPDDIHRSRILFFHGIPLPFHLALRSHFWGASILDRVKDAVENAGTAQTGIAKLITEAKVDVFKIPHLFDLLKEPEGTNLIMERIRLSNLSKSIYNSILMDKEEEYEQKTGALSQGLAGLLEEFLEVPAGASGIPVTRLLGKSPTGLGATGEENTRVYYDSIKALQESDIEPVLHDLDRILFRSTFGDDPPDEFRSTFTSLWQQSETERATTQAQDATRDRTYLDAGVIQEHHIAARLAAEDIYPTLTEEDVAELENEPDDDDDDNPLENQFPFGGPPGGEEPAEA